jgi:PIN domain nuclease of toxin-antitoxin system
VSDPLRIVLDASAVLAYFQEEPGEALVGEALGSARVFVSAANYAEVLNKLTANGVARDFIVAQFRRFGIRIVSLNETDAADAGCLKTETARLGLSLGDCACLALAARLDAVALTADRAWLKAGDRFRIRLIR